MAPTHPDGPEVSPVFFYLFSRRHILLLGFVIYFSFESDTPSYDATFFSPRVFIGLQVRRF